MDTLPLPLYHHDTPSPNTPSPNTPSPNTHTPPYCSKVFIQDMDTLPLVLEGLEMTLRAAKGKYHPKFKAHFRYRTLHSVLLESFAWLPPGSFAHCNSMQPLFVEALRVLRDAVTAGSDCVGLVQANHDTPFGKCPTAKHSLLLLLAPLTSTIILIIIIIIIILLLPSSSSSSLSSSPSFSSSPPPLRLPQTRLVLLLLFEAHCSTGRRGNHSTPHNTTQHHITSHHTTIDNNSPTIDPLTQPPFIIRPLTTPHHSSSTPSLDTLSLPPLF